MKIKHIFLCLLLTITLYSNAGAVCAPGLFLNPITDVCFECVFPLKISGITVVPGTWVNDFPVLTDQPLCACPAPPPIFIRIGIPVSFWNPSRYVESVKDPFCFPGLGISVNPLQSTFMAGSTRETAQYAETKWQAHYFIFPVFELLELMKDSVCMQVEGFDVAMLTEIDPLWQFDPLSAVAFPETVLFATPITPLSCIAEGVTTTVGYSISPLFWCTGGAGSTYPMTGNVTAESQLEGASIAAARMTYTMGRLLSLFDTALNPCMSVPTPIWVKQNFRMQAAKPLRSVSCTPIGTTSLTWGPGVNIPFKENFVFLQFKRVACCAW